MKGSGSIRIFDQGVAVITGGASGIGRALGEALAARGCEVVLADLQDDLAKEVAARIVAKGRRAVGVQVDVADAGGLSRIVQDTYERCGRLDYMFNNAGIAVIGEACDLEISDWNRIIDINLRGVIHGIHAAYPIMRQQGFGHIVNTASLAGLMPFGMMVSYSTTKHAVVGLSKSLRVEAARAGIRVSVLCPGGVRTAMLEDGGKFGHLVGDLSREKMGKIFAARLNPMDVDKCAATALRQITRNEPFIVVPSSARMVWLVDRLSPKLGLAMGRKLFGDILGDLERANHGQRP